MDRVWKSGIMAGAVGALFILLGLVVLGSWFKVFPEQNSLFLILLLLSNLLAFVVAGLASGILASPYARNEMEALKSGMISGGIVALFPVSIVIVATILGMPFISLEPSAILGLFALAIIVVSLVALSGMVSLVYTSIDRLRKPERRVASGRIEDDELKDLSILYKDLRQDARTLVADMNRSILLYLFAGAFTLVYGFVILAYALMSWSLIYSGSAGAADYAAALGETIGGIIQIIVGPLLIRWYFKLKARYARLESIEKGAGE